MELTGKLKDEMAQAKDKEEAKKIMEKAGIKLTDDELDSVAGGLGICDIRICKAAALEQKKHVYPWQK